MVLGGGVQAGARGSPFGPGSEPLGALPQLADLQGGPESSLSPLGTLSRLRQSFPKIRKC